jgi:hypothetical protein
MLEVQNPDSGNVTLMTPAGLILPKAVMTTHASVNSFVGPHFAFLRGCIANHPLLLPLL